jgi:hypothetical protein
MKLSKYILIASALLMGAVAYADDFDSFGDFGSFGDDGTSGAASKLEVNGSADVDIRAYVDTEDKAGDNRSTEEKIGMDVNPAAALEFKYSGSKSDVQLNLKIDEDTVKNHPVDIIDEAVLRGYFDNLTVEAGKMKIVWGKGDKLHVIDNFNADDYSDFIIPDYIDRRISTPMVRAVYSLPVANINIEGVYTPLLATDRFATEGCWTPAQVTALTEGARKIVSMNLLGLEGKAAAANAEAAADTNPSKKAAKQREALAADKAYLEYLTFANKLSANPNSIYPDVKNLKYGQYGLRVLGTAGTVDLGASYYYGWYKQPSVNYSSYIKSIETMVNQIAAAPTLGLAYQSLLAQGKSQSEALQSLAVANGWQFGLPVLAYDRKQTFGLECATVLWHFNVRGELAYNLTDDIAGTDPWVHNNSIAWLGGFDIDLPFWNANLNVQETGTLILNGDECDKNHKKYAEYSANDVDYSKKGYTNNKIVANFSTSFMNDKLAPEITVMYGIERGDLVVMPKLTYKPDQNLTFTASGMIINCANEDSEFYGWRKNSFVSLKAKYQF